MRRISQYKIQLGFINRMFQLFMRQRQDLKMLIRYLRTQIVGGVLPTL